MKGIKITYWVVTSVIALMMCFSAYAYLTQATVEAGFQHLGYPGYFRVELAVAKLTGAILLLTPVSGRIKEWTYAGFTFTFVSAFIAHTAAGDPIGNAVGPIVALLLLALSYFTYHKLQHSVAAATPVASYRY
ncbi:DoxX family protein [Chitinophaga pendula]|uniref:DoxX family protein n=1 Tax=Chitinophaga TaxID=79328 RepID=UPI000BAE98E5|nr:MULTISPECIES: DoxX family protein [Chitinophaga]ASZ13592.1 DoxX-like family protein [Chitinophaga sp. MD30]UCJ08785.1 DoxX family protein [Chitinophaga pendula]